MITLIALKPVYNRKTKNWEVEERTNADPSLVHEGWIVFDSYFTALGMIVADRLMPKSQYTKDKRAAVVDHILVQLGGKVRVDRYFNLISL